MSKRDIFGGFLKENLPDCPADVLEKFDIYLENLYAINQKVNLISRKMEKDDYWTYHFLDSLLIIKCIGFNSGKIMDFGTGGGLPGIPLKLVYPDLEMFLLDSVGKKVKCLEQIVAALGLKNCHPVWSRLEDYAKSSSGSKFDIILCRSVRLEQEFKKPLFKLLKEGGKVIFYKANKLDDVKNLAEVKVCDVSCNEIGTRQIILASRSSFWQ